MHMPKTPPRRQSTREGVGFEPASSVPVKIEREREKKKREKQCTCNFLEKERHVKPSNSEVAVAVASEEVSDHASIEQQDRS